MSDETNLKGITEPKAWRQARKEALTDALVALENSLLKHNKTSEPYRSQDHIAQQQNTADIQAIRTLIDKEDQ